MADHTRSAVHGMSMCVTPRWRTASITALWIAGVDPIVPDSPMPLAPSGLRGLGVSVFDTSKLRSVVPDFVATVPFEQGAREIVAWHDEDAARRTVDPRVDALMDQLVERFVAHRLRSAGPAARLAYHDRATVNVLANLGMSTQLLVLGICVALGRPAAFAWIALAELAFVLCLVLRRDLALRSIARTGIDSASA